MSGLAWVKVSTEVAAHPKTRALGHRIGTTTRDAVGALAMIWTWFGLFYPDGSAPDTEDTVRDIEAAATWAGDPGALFTYLVELALLERRRRRIVVHGWDEWSGTYEAEKQRDRVRKRAKRAEERQARPPDVGRQEADSPEQKEKEKEKEKQKKLDPPVAPRGTAARWERVLAVLRRTVTADLYQRAVAPLCVEAQGDDLVLIPRDEYAREHLVAAHLLPEIERAARQEGFKRVSVQARGQDATASRATA